MHSSSIGTSTRPAAQAAADRALPEPDTGRGLLVVADRAVIDGVATGPAAVLAVGGQIVRVGEPGEVRADPRAHSAQIMDWSGRAMLPGTVNAHNHSFQSLLRGIGDDLPFLQWRERALYRYAPGLGPEGMEIAALLAFGEMLLHGVTTVCDFYYVNASGNDNASATIEAARRLGIRIVLARCFYDWEGAPQSFREDVATAVRNFEDLSRRYTDRTRYLTSVHAAPHSQHGASPAMIEAGRGAAGAAGVPWHMHLAEEKYQLDESLARFGARPLLAVDALGGPAGLVSRDMVVIHGCWFDETERALMAERGAGLVYNPASNMFLGDGITDVVDLRARGVPVALGTDGGCSNNRVSVLDEMRMCALLQKVARCDGQAMRAGEVWQMGTAVGGELLRLPVGRIAPGYRADLVAVDLGDPSLWPLQALAKNVVYALASRAITDVVVDGEAAVVDRRLAQVDMQEIAARVRELTGEWGA